MRRHAGERFRIHPWCWPKRLHHNLFLPWRPSMCSWVMNSVEVKRVLEIWHTFLRTEWSGWHFVPFLVPRVHLTHAWTMQTGEFSCFKCVLVRSIPSNKPSGSQKFSKHIWSKKCYLLFERFLLGRQKSSTRLQKEERSAASIEP